MSPRSRRRAVYRRMPTVLRAKKIARLQQEVTDAFVKALQDYQDSARAFVAGLKDVLLRMCVRELIRPIVRELVPIAEAMQAGEVR